MTDKLRSLYEKHKEIILYLIFGFVTTVASLGAWYLTMKLGVLFLKDENGDPTTLLDAIGSTVQWVVGVLVAFVTNKKWVFVNAEKGSMATLRQLAVFSGSRALTYVLELVMNIGMIYLFEALGYRAFYIFSFEVSERIWAKALTAVAVVIANYILSKLIVFRKKPKSGEK